MSLLLIASYWLVFVKLGFTNPCGRCSNLLCTCAVSTCSNYSWVSSPYFRSQLSSACLTSELAARSPVRSTVTKRSTTQKSNNSPSRRRACEELTERVEGLAQQILDHLADNPATFPPVTSERGRTGRGSGRSNRARRSVSFSNICGCPGDQCISGPGAGHPPPAYSFTPARDSRNTGIPQESLGHREGLLQPSAGQGWWVTTQQGQVFSRPRC
jgi:hypothetical protein